MNNPLFDMTGKVALVTGSTKGIGRSIAEEMARLGAKVVISSRKAEACEQVASELKEQGYEAIAIPCHVGKKEDLQNLVEKTNEAWGTIDVLVDYDTTNGFTLNSAGLLRTARKLADGHVYVPFSIWKGH